jgi:hypothetical protein
MINHIFKPKGERIWRWRFRHSPEDGKIQDISLATTDKQCAERKRSKLLTEIEQERAGLIPGNALRQSATKALTDHLEDYLADLRTLRKNPKYVDLLEHRLGRLLSECGWETLKDVSADSFQHWRRRQVQAPKTANDYREAATGFCNWMKRQGRMTSNPLIAVQKVDDRTVQKRERRAFTPGEVARLCQVVAGERKALYVTAAHTGLRRG